MRKRFTKNDIKKLKNNRFQIYLYIEKKYGLPVGGPAEKYFDDFIKQLETKMATETKS